MPLRPDGAAQRLGGLRIVHISDLHCSRTVSGEYLRLCVQKVNSLSADIVVLTGDYITHDYRGRFREKVAGLLSGLESRLGIFACLGNHDYGIGGTFGTACLRQAHKMADGIAGAGVVVLRNDSSVLDIDGVLLRIVGLGDIWANDFEPDSAFRAVGRDEFVIALAHNPDSVQHMKNFDFDIVMSGHTHGNRLGWGHPGNGSGLSRRLFYSGMYEVGGRKLYVNRGLGRLGKVLFNKRPEITVFEMS